MRFVTLPPSGPNMQTGQTFHRSFSLIPHMLEKTKQMIISMESFSKIVKFMANGSGVQTLAYGQYGHNVKCIKSSSLTIFFSTPIYNHEKLVVWF